MVDWCGFVLILSGFSLLVTGCNETENLEINEGHVFILHCFMFNEDEVVNVEWTRDQNQNQDWDTGIKMIDRSLGFFPVQESHNGNYSCSFSDNDGPYEKHFNIIVVKSKCPRELSHVHLKRNRIDHLKCDIADMSTISKLHSVSFVGWTWMKNCGPLSWDEKSDRLQFNNVSETDEGVYTCLLNFTHNGTSYTMAQSKKIITVDPGPVPQKPRVIKPRQETVTVELGSKQVLNCKVFVGPGSCEMDRIETIRPFWLFDGKFVEENREYFFVSTGCTTENNVEYRHSNLTIFQVQEELFNSPFQCVVQSSMGSDNGTIILIQPSRTALYCILAVLSVYAVAVLGFLLVYLFKVDLVLAYRKFSPCLKLKNDGKLYDAYVSCLHGGDQDVSFATTFALHVLPEVLEEQLGYKLFIIDRDALPGAAVHDVISETVGKSRRLIIVLPSQAFTKSSDNKGGFLNKMPSEHRHLNNNLSTTVSHSSELSPLNWGPYECWVGLYDALVKECLQVILVQVGEEVDDTLLPESLRYIKRTQGILKWKERYTSDPTGRFWKHMRYRMPPVQKAKVDVMV